MRRVGLPLVIAALVTISGLSLGRVYDGPLLLELVAGAAVLSVLVSSVLRRAAPAIVAVVSVVGLLSFALVSVFVSARAGGVDGPLPGLALDAARNAVPRLLTALIPVEAQPDTVLGPVVLAWLAGFAGAELAGRARRPALALVPPTGLYAGALVLVGPNAAIVTWHALAFAALAALGLALGSPRDREPPADIPATINPATTGAAPLAVAHQRRVSLRVGVGLAGGLAVILVAILGVAPLVAARVVAAPGDPRGLVQPPSLDVLDQNPLIRLGGWATNPDQVLFEVALLEGAKPTPSPTPSPTPTAAASDDPFGPETVAADDEVLPASTISAHDTRLRLAVLSDWDGITWHIDADYKSAGRALPAQPSPPGDPKPASATLEPALAITERITIADLQGRLLPAVSAAQRVDGLRVAYDQQTGTLLSGSTLTSGVTYTVSSVTPTIDLNLLPAASVPSGPTVARFLEVGPSVPTDLATFARNIVEGEGSPYLRALALENFLSTHYRFAADAPTGHSYPNLSFFLLTEEYAGGKRGTSEQFATAFAALGRLLGLPTRVVVGFTTPAGGGAVTGADAVAWPEVLFEGIGWVPFNPLPRTDAEPRPIEDSVLPKPLPPTSAPPPQSYEPPPSFDPASAGPSGLAVEPGASATAIAGGVGGGLLALLVLLVVLVVVLRALQTRARLTSGTPPQRVLGAWDEVLDALALAGSPAPPHLAAAEVAQHAAHLTAPAASHPGTASRPGRGATASSPTSSSPTAPGATASSPTAPGATASSPTAPGATASTPSSLGARLPTPRPAMPPLDDLAAKVNAASFAGPTGAAPDAIAAHGARMQAVAFTRALYSTRSWWRRLLWRIDPRPLRRRRTTR